MELSTCASVGLIIKKTGVHGCLLGSRVIIVNRHVKNVHMLEHKAKLRVKTDTTSKLFIRYIQNKVIICGMNLINFIV